MDNVLNQTAQPAFFSHPLPRARSFAMATTIRSGWVTKGPNSNRADNVFWLIRQPGLSATVTPTAFNMGRPGQ
ncbi:hypothetical protein SJA_C1-17990 [Sphingobium indicum UT26S]|uniref:Uncharacterized protein n=1 Tax=Sphingobium indicum (strain DSM 16413 / CCM 7287 / MTCC 6362 / UT26 / NBRC 101211 / UT26S) TaxID=452662 RepID=D4Z201_SPHIU|nr:hypothetical protein SJA_C1-17990 [Sphingobium indicum UT26S]